MPAIAKYYSPFVDEGFSVERLNPTIINQDALEERAKSVRDVVFSSWSEKFVPHTLSEREVDLKVLSEEQQYLHIKHPLRGGKYWLACSNRPGGTQDNAVLRIETYTPRRASRILWRTKPYPNVTDLETQNGQIHGRFEKHAAALLYHALGDFSPDLKVSAYGEKPNQDGLDFYRSVGFKPTGNEPCETIGRSVMYYVHLEASHVDVVRLQLEQQYPFLTADPYGQKI